MRVVPQLMPRLHQLFMNVLLGLGLLVVATNGWSLLLDLPSFQPENLVFLLVGALMIGLGFLARTREASHWAQYRERALQFAAAHKWWLIVAAAVSIGGSLLVGLPGVALMALLDRGVDLFAGPLGWSAPHGDTLWPLALAYSFLGPWVCFSIYLGIGKLSQSRPSAWRVAFVCTVAFLVFHSLFRFLNRLG